MAKKQYFCTVFFMVLDLRLNEKVGLSSDNLLFCPCSNKRSSFSDNLLFCPNFLAYSYSRNAIHGAITENENLSVF